MSNIEQALSLLQTSVGRLETTTRDLERTPKGQTRDMFAAIKPKKNSGFSADNAVIAQRLDKAIRKVEALLEG